MAVLGLFVNAARRTAAEGRATDQRPTFQSKRFQRKIKPDDVSGAHIPAWALHKNVNSNTFIDL
jgi:hypothetical protein